MGDLCRVCFVSRLYKERQYICEILSPHGTEDVNKQLAKRKADSPDSVRRRSVSLVIRKTQVTAVLCGPVSSQSAHVEALTPDATLFGDGVFRVVIKVVGSF